MENELACAALAATARRAAEAVRLRRLRIGEFIRSTLGFSLGGDKASFLSEIVLPTWPGLHKSRSKTAIRTGRHPKIAKKRHSIASLFGNRRLFQRISIVYIETIACPCDIRRLSGPV
jgi:hypothetical protein